MTFPVFLDTCVLYPATLCDTLLRLAEAGAFRPLWSAGVLTELRRNLIERAGVTAAQADYRISEMQRAFPDAEVQHYESLIPAMTNHPKDRHVLAAAVRSGAALIVTFNLKDFEDDSLAPYDIEARHPDDFLLDQFDLNDEATTEVLRLQVADHQYPPRSLDELADTLERTGLPQFAAMIRSVGG